MITKVIEKYLEVNTIRISDLQCSPSIIKGLNEMGFEETTPIQTQTIPVIMEGKDVVGQAQTGTGKTAAFAIPVIDMVDPADRNTQALILCPTRELAIQISEEFSKIGKYKEGVKVLPVFGGQSIDRQILRLKKGVQVVIGTPGRIMDHLRRKTLKLNNLKIFVLDEADEMLNMGFREDIETILESTNEDRQTLLFSATMPKEIMAIINKFQKDPVEVKITRKELSTPNIKQTYVTIHEKDKMEVLARFFDAYEPKRAIVFCNTKKRVDDVTGDLQTRGYLTDKIHGDMTQMARLGVINKFKTGDIEILVATDVAARGLDINDVEYVFNYDVPNHDEYYVHRIGRTGRAGKDGQAISFVTMREFYLLKNIMGYTKQKIDKISIPNLKDIESIKVDALSTKIKSYIDEGSLQPYMAILDNITSDDHSSIEVAAALLKLELGNLNLESKKDPISEVTIHDRGGHSRNQKGRGNGSSKPKKKPYGEKKSYGEKKPYGDRKPFDGPKRREGKPKKSAPRKSDY